MIAKQEKLPSEKDYLSWRQGANCFEKMLNTEVE